MAPGADDIAPAEGVADASHDLPGEPRTAGADVEVVRKEPAGSLHERGPPLDADDGVPVVQLLLTASRAVLQRNRSHVAAELPAELRRHVELAQAEYDIGREVGIRHEPVSP